MKVDVNQRNETGRKNEQRTHHIRSSHCGRSHFRLDGLHLTHRSRGTPDDRQIQHGLIRYRNSASLGMR